MASNITVDALTVDTLTKGSTTLNTDEIVDTNSNQICKAWVNFNGTGTVAIRDSSNVSSIIDNGSGYYTVNFSSGMSSANYAAITSADGDNSTWTNQISTQELATASFKIRIDRYQMRYYSPYPVHLDSATLLAAVFGD